MTSTDAPQAPGSQAVGRRAYLVATGYGLLAGAVTCATFFLMRGVQHLVWDERSQWWYIALMVLLGGALIAALRRVSLDADLDEQVDPGRVEPRQWRRIGLLGLSAVIAVGFGGAIGPEAGLVAVVTELSIVVRGRIARSRAEAELITEAGSAAALSGFYGAPPVGAAYRQDALGPGRLPLLCASLAGFLGFALTWRLLGLETHALEMPASTSQGALPSPWIIAPALLASVLGCGYLLTRHALARLLARLGSPVTQTLVGSAALAVVLATWPVLRFSGHDDFGALGAWAAGGAWGVLAAVGCAKVAATALSLAAGWRGGDVFPLMFAGGAVGAATAVLLPGLDLQAAMVAGMAAACVVGLRKPVAVFVLVLFIVPGADAVALAVACGLGVLALQVLPDHPALAGDPHTSH